MTTAEANPIFKVSPNAVFETFDDEVVVINMASGSYYALDAIALGIWNLVQEQHPLHRIVEATQQVYKGEPDAIESAVKAFVDDLEQEDLIIRLRELREEAVEPTTSTLPADVPADRSAGDGPRPTFQDPVLTKFTDMQDLLLLDPIHEVDETGWPHPKAEPARAASASEKQHDSSG